MHKRINQTVGVAILGLLVGCTGPKENASPITSTRSAISHKIQCAIEPSKSQFKSGEPILISVAVRNLSDAPVHVAFWGLQKEEPIVNFQILGSSGKTLLVSTKQNLWCGTGVENVPIPINREYKVSVDLLKTWEWGGTQTKVPPGVYTVSAELFSTTADGGSPKVAESRHAKFTVVADEQETLENKSHNQPSARTR